MLCLQPLAMKIIYLPSIKITICLYLEYNSISYDYNPAGLGFLMAS